MRSRRVTGLDPTTPAARGNTTGQLVSLDGPAGTTTWTWLDNQWLGAQTLPNGAYTEYTYLPNGKLSTLTKRDEEGNLLSRYLDLQYKGTGDLLHVGSDVPGGMMPTAPTQRRRDHREAQSRAGLSAPDSAHPPCLCVSAVQSAKPANGNPTSYAGTTCTYDVENHLTACGTNFTAGYRGDGLRAWQDSVAGKTYYRYDAWRPVQELDEDGTPTKTYTFGANGLVAYGDALSQYDWQGNAANGWDDGGNPVTGLVLAAWGAPNAAYKWQHGYGGGGTDLVFCTYRYLDPTRGRWVTRDPIGYEGGVGLYAYLSNAPVTGADPSGLDGHLQEPWWYKYLCRSGPCLLALANGMGAGGLKITLKGVTRWVRSR